MANIPSVGTLSRNNPKVSSSVSSQQHSLLSAFIIMSMTIAIILVSFCPYASCSPTSTHHNNKINYETNGYVLDPTDYQKGSSGDSSLVSPTVQRVLPRRSSWRYTQPRTYANQFLISHNNNNGLVSPKWLTGVNNNDQTYDIYNYNDEDLDDYIPSGIFYDKRSKYNTDGKITNLAKRKQAAKPPMEVMNEIVNSIYLKR